MQRMYQTHIKLLENIFKTCEQQLMLYGVKNMGKWFLNVLRWYG